VRFFGRPEPLPEALDAYLAPWSVAEAQERYLARAAALGC
jgi:hypothetical protein